MGKGPGLYTEIGKKTRDLLYKDYNTDQKFTISTYTSHGVALTSSSTKKGELFFSDVSTQLKNKNVTTEVKVDTNSRVAEEASTSESPLPKILLGGTRLLGFQIYSDSLVKRFIEELTATVTVDQPAPGVKAILNFAVPDQSSGKVELQYQHDYAGVSTSIGMNANPIVNVSGVFGSNIFALGTDVALDTASGKFIKYNAGLSFSNADLVVALSMNDMGDTLNASYYHTVRALTNTAVGAELTHSFSSNVNTFTFGTQHALDPLTSVKARFNNSGKASALIQHEWRPKSLFTVSAEVDTKAIEKSAKVGLSLVLKP